MRAEFLHKNHNSKELILVFGGFASKPGHFSHLKSEKTVLLLFDYEDFSLKIDLNSFENITLIAFSMGVCVASKMMKNIPFQQKIALNGTNTAIDRERGIHPAIFSKSIKNFSLKNFKKSLLSGRENLAGDFRFKDEARLKNELESLFYFCQKEPNLAFSWDRVYASRGDEIFPTRALEKSFKNLIFLNEPHFAFFHFHSWENL